MLGIIALVNIDDNSGIVVDEKKKQYPFSLDECVGFETYPEVGEKVEFGLNDGEVYFVEPNSNKTDTNAQIALGDKAPIKLPVKKSTFQLDLLIPLDKDINDCLENY